MYSCTNINFNEHSTLYQYDNEMDEKYSCKYIFSLNVLIRPMCTYCDIILIL